MDKSKFIWLSKENYPFLQESAISYFASDKMKYKFGVAGFKRKYEYVKIIKKAEIQVFGDNRYYLWINNSYVGMGPVPSGGDTLMPFQYSSHFVVDINCTYIDFYAQVQLTNVAEYDNSCGKGGFTLSAKIIFDDGSFEEIHTDDSWLARQEKEYISPRFMDYTMEPDSWNNAVEVENIWSILPSEIKNLDRKIISSKQFYIKKQEKKEFIVELDKIYSAYPIIDIIADGDYEIKLISFEIDGVMERTHKIIGNKSEIYHSHEMDSVGGYKLIVENKSDSDITINAKIMFVCYPFEEKGKFECSDEKLNEIYELGKWTVQICRQSIELDSPAHLENLLCTGDYLIESLVNNVITGDYSLTRFDIVRMARYFVATNGYKYHTTYALIWMEMLYEYYIYTGDLKIFEEILDGMETMLDRFETFEDKNGILDNVTNYMFVDWVYIDGYGLNNPPRALGETYLNELYYNALVIASKIYSIIGNDDKSSRLLDKSEKFKKTINETFFDKEKGLYFDGRNIQNEVNRCMPQNPIKRYYTMYSNVMAVLCGLCTDKSAEQIIRTILDDENMNEVQPYFMHFVLQAVTKVGLFKEYGLKLIRKWEPLVTECNKGMKEVWITFDGYATDYSHGWGTTPTYQLPTKLIGLEILEPGFKKISLSPDLCGLEWADITLPTPYGNIICKLRKDKNEIIVPDEIEVVK